LFGLATESAQICIDIMKQQEKDNGGNVLGLSLKE